MASENSYIIVGAEDPSADVRLIDRTPFPCQNGASWDQGKIIRADYKNIMYMKMGLEAQESWKKNPLFNRFYHETGMMWFDTIDGIGDTIISNHKKLNSNEKVRSRSIEEAKALCGGVFADSNYTGIDKVLINENAGWADAAKALTNVIEASVEAGIKYTAADVSSIEFGSDGNCTGVRTSSGETYLAKHIVLATGANTTKVIADSAPDRPEMQVGDRMVATGVCNAMAHLSPEDVELLRSSPAFSNSTSPTIGCGIPPNMDGQIKIFRDTSFKNTIEHTSGQSFSAPPSLPDYGQWNVSKTMKDEVRESAVGFFGKKGANFDLQSWRICWDALTPSQDFIITPHPHSTNLYLATGGSFHGWKFLPTIGKYVVQMLRGSLDEHHATTWAWDREENPPTHGSHKSLTPQRELRDIM